MSPDAGRRAPDERSAPLHGVRVVDAGTFITAPFAAMMLAQLGAEVTKVEPPTGDAYRRFGHQRDGLSAVWINVNHDKTVVSLDLKSPEGAARMAELLRDADVFVHNWRPSVAEHLGLDAATLRAADPRLIHVAISGYGASGPNAGAPVFDTILQATTGLALLEAHDDRPAPLRSFVADKSTALYVTQSVLAALYERTRTGEGATLELAMLDTMAHFNFCDLFAQRTFLDDTAPVPKPNRPLVLETSDGYVCLAPVRGSHLRATVEAMGHPEWTAELKAAPDQARLVEVLAERVEPETRRRTSAECLKAFTAAGVPATIVADADQHLADPQTAHNQLYRSATSPVGPVRRVRHPLIRNGQPLR